MLQLSDCMYPLWGVRLYCRLYRLRQDHDHGLAAVQCANNRRLITIEEGSREFDLVKRDAQGNILNSVVHLLTRPSENPALNINQDFLLERVLRKHPDVIGVGEMRSAAESLSAAESSRTGHTVCTTIHSNSCNSTYRR